MQRFVGVAPVTMVACRTSRARSDAFVYANEPVPASADPVDVERLAAEGFLAPAGARQVASLAPPGSWS